MKEQPFTGPRHGVSIPDRLAAPVLISAPRAPGRALALRADPFMQSVAAAQLDVLLLHATSQAGAGLDTFQLLLRAMCASARRVERAGLYDGHISLSVDGVALAFGPDRLPDRRSGVYHQPDTATRSGCSARLGFFLYRHQACTRLRIASGASPDLLQDVLTLVLRCAPPKVVVLRDRRIVLSRAEVMQLAPADMAALRPGAPVPRPVSRYVRPGGRGSSAPPSAFDSRRGAPRTLPLETMIAATAALREESHLRAALRPYTGTGRAGGVVRPRALALGVLAASALLWVWNRGGVFL